MSIQYREHQEKAISAAVQRMLDTTTKDLIEIPTGGGKTYVIVGITLEAIKHGLQVIIITPRVRLLEQTYEDLRNLGKVDVGIMSGQIGSDTGHAHQVIIVTPQTLIRRDNMAKRDLIIVDEAHLLPLDSEQSKKTSEIRSMFPHAKVIGLTATPYRGKDWLIDSEWQSIHCTKMRELIEMKWLVRPISMTTDGSCISSDDDVSNLPWLTRRIVKNLMKSIKDKDRKKVLVFARDIEHARMIEEFLLRLGEEHVGIIHSELTKSSQDAAYNRFEHTKDRSWLINVNLATVGVDIPCIDAIAIVRNVTSLALLIQIIGRGLRISPSTGKVDCLIYDFGTGTKTFGCIDDPMPPDDTNAVRRDLSGFIVFKTCVCGAQTYRSARICPSCGQQFKWKTHLSENSNGSELLPPAQLAAGDIVVLTVASSEVTQNAYGTFDVVHKFEGDHDLFSFSAHKDKVLPYSPGTRLVCHLSDLPHVRIMTAA